MESTRVNLSAEKEEILRLRAERALLLSELEVACREIEVLRQRVADSRQAHPG